jgi:hypothetical protein
MSDDPIQSDDPVLPEALRGELSRLYRADARVPTDVDRVITNRARAHLSRGSGRLRLLLLRTAGAAAAVAAVIAIAMLLIRTPPPRLAHAVEDVNGDGVVDIRDALALQRSLDDGLTKGHDVNHDGVTDRRDVDAVAMLAVRLDGGAVR